MRIIVRVKAGSKTDSVEETGKGQFLVHTKSPAIEGRANKAVIKILSEHLNIPKGSIFIISGRRSKNKILEI